MPVSPDPPSRWSITSPRTADMHEIESREPVRDLARRLVRMFNLVALLVLAGRARPSPKRRGLGSR